MKKVDIYDFSAYLYGELDEERKKQVDIHLSQNEYDKERFDYLKYIYENKPDRFYKEFFSSFSEEEEEERERKIFQKLKIRQQAYQRRKTTAKVIKIGLTSVAASILLFITVNIQTNNINTIIDGVQPSKSRIIGELGDSDSIYIDTAENNLPPAIEYEISDLLNDTLQISERVKISAEVSSSFYSNIYVSWMKMKGDSSYKSFTLLSVNNEEILTFCNNNLTYEKGLIANFTGEIKYVDLFFQKKKVLILNE